MRRAGNPALPEFLEKKRDAKAADKQQEKQAKTQEDIFDEDGKVILTEKDFDNP